MATQQEIDQFHHFASEHLRRGGGEFSMVELFDLWQEANPSLDELTQSVRAVKAALADRENGETGRVFSEFAADMRERYGLATPDPAAAK